MPANSNSAPPLPLPTKVTVSDQVLEFQQAQHPELRRALKAAILGLAKGQGDIKPLEDDLAGYNRLAVRGVRVIYAVTKTGEVQCIFAERRKMVYELFAARLQELLD